MYLVVSTVDDYNYVIKDLFSGEEKQCSIDELSEMQKAGSIILGLMNNNRVVSYNSFDDFIARISLRTKLSGAVFNVCKGVVVIAPTVTEVSEDTLKWYYKPIINAIIIPAVNDWVSVRRGAFNEFTNLKYVVMYGSIDVIEDSAFMNCVNLRKVILSDCTGRIDSYAFSGCSSLESIKVPDFTTVLNTGAFRDCKSLRDVKLSNNMSSISQFCFFSCSSLEYIDIPDSVKSIKSRAFGYCTSLKEVNMSGVMEIRSYAFRDCSSLESLVLPSTLNSIGDMAFCNCRSLKLIEIPESVIEIGKDIFEGCPDIVVRCKQGSAIDIYCRKNSIPVRYVTNIDLGAFMRDVAALQNGYRGLIRSEKLSKKNICDLCVPFRDKYLLTDLVTLSLAREEKSLSEIIEIFDSLK